MDILLYPWTLSGHLAGTQSHGYMIRPKCGHLISLHSPRACPWPGTQQVHLNLSTILRSLYLNVGKHPNLSGNCTWCWPENTNAGRSHPRARASESGTNRDIFRFFLHSPLKTKTSRLPFYYFLVPISDHRHQQARNFYRRRVKYYCCFSHTALTDAQQ